jgi:hypothetical protein
MSPVEEWLNHKKLKHNQSGVIELGIFLFEHCYAKYQPIKAIVMKAKHHPCISFSLRFL